MLKVSSIIGNRQHLDGGAMFGNVPRVLWEKWCEVDEIGRIDLACRCFLVESQGTKLLIEAGVGAFFSPRLAERYGVMERDHRLISSLQQLGVAPADIDVILLSHLHFDHAGGLLDAYREGQDPQLCFPRAEYVVGEDALERAKNPHPRDRASFITRLTTLLEQSGRLHLARTGVSRHPLLGEQIELLWSEGHTKGMLLPKLIGSSQRAVFCSDLVPGAPWVHLPVSMGYDRYPEKLIDEKAQLYEHMGEGSWLLFTHDPKISAGSLHLDERGKYGLRETRGSLVRWDLDQDSLPHL